MIMRRTFAFFIAFLLLLSSFSTCPFPVKLIAKAESSVEAQQAQVGYSLKNGDDGSGQARMQSNTAIVQPKGSGLYTYSLNGDGITITGYSDDETVLIIPARIDGYLVTQISGWVFHNSTSLQQVELPDSITAIGDCAFSNCVALEVISLPSELKYLVGNP